MDISDYIEQCRKQYPDIRPFQEEDDIEWWNQGLDCIKAGDLDAAEETFKKLLLAQPDHSDGFNGLGLVYEKRKDWAKAELFLREAINKAEEMVKDGDMDAEVADMIRSDLDRVLKR
jgi:tetratricopeptide (TPR) repeat protein